MVAKKDGVWKPRASGQRSMGLKVTKIVKKALDDALTKNKLCELLEITFPTLQDRLYRSTWTPRELITLQKHHIIKEKWRDLDSSANEGLVEGEGSLLPDSGLYVPGRNRKKG